MRFNLKDQAEKAVVALDGSEVLGSKITVKFAVQPSNQPPSQSSHQPSNHSCSPASQQVNTPPCNQGGVERNIKHGNSRNKSSKRKLESGRSRSNDLSDDRLTLQSAKQSSNYHARQTLSRKNRKRHHSGANIKTLEVFL